MSQGHHSCGDRPRLSHLKTCNVGGDLILLASTELAWLSNVLLEKKTTAQIEEVSWKSHETPTAAKTPRKLPSLLASWDYSYGFEGLGRRGHCVLTITIWKKEGEKERYSKHQDS